LVEYDSDTARPVERAGAERIFLQVAGQHQHLGLFVGCEVVVAQEVRDWILFPRAAHRRHDWPPLSSTPGSALRKSSICPSAITSGGASRIPSGAGAVAREP